MALEIDLYKKLGVVEEIGADEIRRMEPNLAPVFHKALYFPDALHYLSPTEVCATMARHFAAQGGTLLHDDVTSISRRSDGRVSVRASTEIACDQIVLAAGAHSMRLAGEAVEKLPLESERGYHIVFGGNDSIISRTCSSATAGFAMTPMNDGLRCAGMVELAGLDKLPNPECHAYLERTARRFLPGLKGRPTTTWMGFRPSMPDALPVIGRSKRTPQIVFAFGHHHVGMSSGCVTGKIVADIVAGEKPIVDLAPFSPTRF
jgi:glycine/D-amino acid oxidase-like deaminating enzyme